jgi:dephospho-CoA kinase
MAADLPARRPLVIGVTGGIGSGKSTAAQLFVEHGAAVIDTDAIAHALTQSDQPGSIEIARRFGPEYLTPEGALDRPRMRARVFADPAARRDLEAILHPLIRAQVDREIAQVRAPYVLLLIPLLVETGGYRKRVDRVLVVDIDEAQQLTRTMTRSNLSEEQVRAIMATQATRAQRLAAADDILDNGTDLDGLRAQVDALHRRYVQLAGN